MSWLVIVAGYLIGSIPTAYIFGHVLKGADIRRLGDRNAGAANVFRELNRVSGIAVGIIDAGKGVVAVLIALASGQSQTVVMFTGAAAVIGHNWPVFIGFKGGRGVSTTIGVLLVLEPLPVVILGVPSILALIIGRNVILACAVLFVPLSLVGWLTGTPLTLIAYSVALPLLVGITHFIRTRSREALRA